MTRLLQSLEEILDAFDIAVLDQWGVLHNGSTPYPHAAAAMEILRKHGKEIIILSNSGKRAAPNRQRIQNIGLPVEAISQVVTSGEALWEDLHQGRLTIQGGAPKKIYPICAHKQDPIDWADGGRLEIVDVLEKSTEMIMLMGLLDGSPPEVCDPLFHRALQYQTPLVCSNPDKASPRAGGLVVSPGALAERYEKMGGEVIWYGKPYAPIYQAVVRSAANVEPRRFLMIGDSLEHDIGGAQNAGFSSAFIRGGVHAEDFFNVSSHQQIAQVITSLAKQKSVGEPDYSLEFFS